MTPHTNASVLRYWRIRPPLGRYLRTGHEAWRLTVLLSCGNWQGAA
jgi:hypothetical protein